ncbi:hypothetical protein P691DRAFT_847753 [Macrolepiota fuliginosa MF-IS2]|uniref:Uncharacterized protein n=1 Tax=Macrolepiota fuliginosa MF-IS2 TaxID=1400762 RepID=A0A9P5X082_9AGAR|nr:hypothetical protein P691DRAFT_847753 [Macrolepiota fuliginosa MF-IS2]
MNKGHTIYLNGSTDYLALLLTSDTGIQRILDLGLTQKRSRYGLKAWNIGIIEILEQHPTSRATILEAKWPGAKLDKHVPQVIAEALGLHLRTRRKFIPFCLTNAYEWIFGVVKVTPGEDFAAEFWMTRRCAIKGNPAEVMFVLSALHFWSTEDGEVVWKLGAKSE